MDMKILKYASNTYSIISSALTPPNGDSQILDPITTIFKLCILGFKETGTKIRIQDNRIAFQIPNYIQGVSRWSKGDKRDDLHNLHNPLKIFSRYTHKGLDEEDLKFMIGLAIDGLNLLKEAYKESSIVNHSINHYIGLLNKSKIKQKKEGKEDLDIQENLIYNEIKRIWTKRQLMIVCNILREIKDKYDKKGDENAFIGDDYNFYLQSVENILYSKDIVVEEYLRKITSGN